MSLDNFYKLRKDFTLIGLTGRMGGGCNDIATILSSETNPFIDLQIPDDLHVNEKQKFRICKDLVTNENNTWKKFQLLEYKNVLLLFFLSEFVSTLNSQKDQFQVSDLVKIFTSIYDSDVVKSPRAGQEDKTKNLIEKEIFPFLNESSELVQTFVSVFKLSNSKINIDNIEDSCTPTSVDAEKFTDLFFGQYSGFCDQFYNLIDKIDPVARQLFLQDIASNLRTTGTIRNLGTHEPSNIYVVAKVIKNIIKITKKATGTVRIVIDSLKNSLEINFFKERYSGFYLISSNRDYTEVQSYLEKKLSNVFFNKEMEKLTDVEKDTVGQVLVELIDLDNEHYKIGEFKKGNFTHPDLENCIQKADYYVFNKFADEQSSPNGQFTYYTIEMQLLKLIALIQKPGIITPNAMERTMQLAFSSKYNSGCISRQVGAVVTDEFYSVKSIGWNEVPQGQTPCSLRNVTDLIEGQNPDIFTEYEKNEGDYEGETFHKKTKDLIPDGKSIADFKNDLNGHNCPFCFKELHNAFEGKDNQVHTRSLHAEENAMLQISKYGGQPLKGGNLFTTASPCELCSKKAYQLGIENIFYIDPYPGISKNQILKGGPKNPHLYMFQGAVGRGFFKLFEPYMSIKDETKLRFKLKPVPSQKIVAKQLKSILASNLKNSKNVELINYLDGLEEDKLIIEKVISLMNDGLSIQSEKK